MMVSFSFWIGALCVVPSQSFSRTAKSLSSFNSVRHAHVSSIALYAESGDENGGTAWIKKAMGSEENGDGSGSSSPPSNGSPDFSQAEISDMEGLIISLSKVTDDDKRREALAGILDTELDAVVSSSTFDQDVPRFAKLFQLSLDSVGETVQNAARKKAMEQQELMESSRNVELENDESEGGERIERVKTEEELQLWALIDMMVQSKTRIKLHMGSLGSKGEFR